MCPLQIDSSEYEEAKEYRYVQDASAEQMHVLLAGIYNVLRVYVKTYTRDIKRMDALKRVSHDGLFFTDQRARNRLDSGR